MRNSIAIYVDNYRGFSDTQLELKDVNFLVGENSSGKTSLLMAVRLLSDPQFWTSLDTTTKIGGSNHFSDCVSASSSNKSRFSLGIIWTAKDKAVDPAESPTQEKSARFLAILLVFEDDKGQPGLGQCIFQVDDLWCSLTLRKKTSQVIVREKVPVPIDKKRVFREWASAVDSGSSPQVIKRKAGYPLFYSILDALVQFDRTKADTPQKAQDAVQRRSRVINELMTMTTEIAWIAPIRTKPKRTYDEFSLDYSSEGEHTPYLIKHLLSRRTVAGKFRKYLEKIGKQSGLFRSVDILRYGKGETSPFELDVVLGADTLGINNVGYGVSQSLPIFVELFARSKHSWFAIQQPEVHLHPKAQAAIGELIYELASKDSKRFIIETHSDYLIDRFRKMKREGKDTRPDAQVIYCERANGMNVSHSLEISHDGTLPSDQPEGYRHFFVNEALSVLSIG